MRHSKHDNAHLAAISVTSVTLPSPMTEEGKLTHTQTCLNAVTI